LSAIVESYPDDDVGLEITDLSTVPTEPPDDLFYQHRPSLLGSALAAWRRKDVMYTLAERDIRASYKQAVLGLGWAVIMPLFSLIIFTVIFHNVKSMQLHGPGGTVVPYALVTFVGMWAWGLFSGALGGGASALLANKVLMAKTHFPRECFPMSQVLESAFTSLVALAPMTALFAVYHYTPSIATLWFPVYLLVEIPFIIGVTLFASGVIVQARDLQQVLPVMTQFGMFATPVIWQFDKLKHIHVPGIPGVHNFQPIYSFINPLGPVVGGIKGSILLGQAPPWGLLGIASVSSILYMWIGYSVFKRLEVNFADLC
jgi:ABC-type polysaccharide/polyol phosphate export permease